jgi:WD40 repeat protein
MSSNTMRTAVQVESLANITELHEPLALDGSMAPGAGSNRAAFEGDEEYDTWRGRDFGIWSIAWSPQGGQLIAGGWDHKKSAFLRL